MTDFEVKSLIEENYGFNIEKIELIQTDFSEYDEIDGITFSVCEIKYKVEVINCAWYLKICE